MPPPPAAATPSTSRIYLPFLDGLRGLAALYVVLDHCWQQSWPIYNYPATSVDSISARITHWLIFGHYSVTVFIAISGFSLGLPVVRSDGRLKGGARSFFKRRAIRILPPYYAALILSYIVAGVFLSAHTHSAYDQNFPLTPFGFAAHALLIHDLFSIQFQSNGPLWSVALECQIYLFFPLLVLLRRRAGMGSAFLFSLVAGFGIFWGGQLAGLLTSYSYYLWAFGIGMFAAHVCFGERPVISKRYILSVATLSLVGILASILVHLYAPTPWRTQLSMVLIGSLLFYLAALVPRREQALAALGTLSGLAAIALLVKGGQYADTTAPDIFVGIAAGCLLVVCTRCPSSIPTRLLSWRHLEALGAFSYSLYLIHAPFQQLLWQLFIAPFHLQKDLGFWIMATLGTAALIGIAYLFFMAFERPFLKRTKVGSMRAEMATEHPRDRTLSSRV